MQANTLRAGLAAAALTLGGTAAAALTEGQFLPEQAPIGGIAANGGTGTLTIGGDQYPLPPELNPVSATTINLSPGRQLVVSHRTPEITDACSGSSVQHMYHRIPANPGEPLPLIETVCLTEPRAFQGHYEQPGLSTQQVAALRERTPLTTFDQRISFVRLDSTPGVVASQLYAEDVESVQFSPSGTVALVKYDLPGGALDPADYRFIDLCPGTFGNGLMNFPNVGAGARASVENDGAGGFRVRFAHPSFAGGATTFPIVDCLGSPPPPPPGEQPLRVTLNGNGSGRVTSVPFAINCPAAACQSNFTENTSVTLTAAADPGSTFAGWAGDCSGTQTSASITMDAARECQATFTRPAADLGLTCSGPGEVVAGDRWAVQFDVSNAGPDQSLNTQLDVPATPGLALVANESSAGCFGASDGSVACNLFQIPASENVRINLVFAVDPFARGTLTAAGSLSNSLTDPIGGNNECAVFADLTVDVDLELSKSAAPDPVGAGELLVYELDVRNNGRSGALEVEIADNLPPEVAPVSPAGAGVCSIGQVSPDAVVTATLVTRVLDGLANGTVISNTATVTTSDADANPADNTDTENVIVGAGAAPPGTTFRQIDREFVNGRTNVSVPSQSGANTAYFANTGNGNPGVYVSVDGQATVEAYGNQRAIPGFGGSYVNVGIGFGTPALEGLATAWSGQYFGDAGIVSGLVSLADGCVARGLFDESTFDDDPTINSLVVTDLQLRNNRLAFASQFAGVVGIREPGGGFNLRVRPDTQLPASGGLRDLGSVGGMAFDGQDIAFSVAGGCGLVIPDCTYQGVFIAGSQGLTLVADSGTAIPGGSGNFRGFGFQPNTMSMHNGQLAFLGYDDQRRAGIYLYAGGEITELVGPTTPLPGTADVFATEGVGDSGAVLSLSAPALKNGVVAFVGGNFGAGVTGLWTIRQGVISPIIRTGELLNGDRVDDVRIGPESLGVDRIAFLARVADGQSAGADDGIFTTSVNTTLVFANGFE